VRRNEATARRNSPPSARRPSTSLFLLLLSLLLHHYRQLDEMLKTARAHAQPMLLRRQLTTSTRLGRPLLLAIPRASTSSSSSTESVGQQALALRHPAFAPSPSRAKERLFSSTTALERERKPFVLADIGEGITEVEIVKWCVLSHSQLEEQQEDRRGLTLPLAPPHTGSSKRATRSRSSIPSSRSCASSFARSKLT